MITEAGLIEDGWRLQTSPKGLIAWGKPRLYVQNCHTHIRLILIDDQQQPPTWMLEICQTDDAGIDAPDWSKGIGLPFWGHGALEDFVRALEGVSEHSAIYAESEGE
jgi:hypothetical protein